jgi:RNA polymerase sigma-70 factor (ECF subfamily)
MTLTSSGALPAMKEEPHSPEDRPDRADLQRELQDLYRQHSGGLIRRLARRTGCDETARDLAHEAFLRFVSLRSAGSGIGHPEAYLRRISTNLVRDWARWPSRRQVLPPGFADLAPSQLDGVAVLEARDTLRRLELAMSRLKPKTRQIFLAHRLDGLSYAEIAEITGLSVKGVEKQMSKAIAKIDRLLDRG